MYGGEMEPQQEDALQPRSEFWICHHDSHLLHASEEALGQARDYGYNTLTVPITTQSFYARIKVLLTNHLSCTDGSEDTAPTVPHVPQFTVADTYLGPAEVVPKLLGIVSPWIDLCSPDPVLYGISMQVLEMEVAFASFCGLASVVLPAPRIQKGGNFRHGISQYAHAVQEVLSVAAYMQFTVKFPMWDGASQFPEPWSNLAEFVHSDFSENAEESCATSIDSLRRHDFFGSWDAWNIIRSVCKYNIRLCVGLEIPKLLPPSSVCSRWQSEPLRILFLDSSTFFANKIGYPVLTANHRALIAQYTVIKNSPAIVLSVANAIHPTKIYESDTESLGHSLATGPNPATSSVSNTAPTPAEARASELRPRSGKHPKVETPLTHLTYLRWFQDSRPLISAKIADIEGYQDYLQAPLQPLTDNLESLTYEVFEKDPVKYDLYEKAICNALEDWRDQDKPISEPNGRIVLAIVGAGRGPLVTRARKASVSAGVPIELWALEKNPNAFVLLQRHNVVSWNNEVKLVKSDMRNWKGPIRFVGPANPPARGLEQPETIPPREASRFVYYPIDIIISELLGSFADNELSPECLDGILPLLNPTHGISIPQSYSAHLTPIAAPILHSDILARAANDASALNTPCVVMLHQYDYLATKSPRSAYGPDSIALPTANGDTPPPSQHAADTSDEDGMHMLQPPRPIVLQAWSFHHGPSAALPSDSVNKHNLRHATLSFDVRNRGACHGLAGYFESVLYPGVELSTNPLNMDQKSPNMMSWFPFFFPLKNPLYVPDHSTLTVTMFRETDNRKVWYEWLIEAWSNKPSPGFRLGVSEMGSSREKGCMM